MAVSFLPQAQIRAGNPLLDLAQLNQGLASVQRSNELQADRALQQQQMQSQDARQNQLIELQKRRMDMDAEQNAMANRRADAQLAIQQGEYGLRQQNAQQAAARAKAEKVARLGQLVEGNQARWDYIRSSVPDINEDLPPDIANDPVRGPRALQLMVFGPTNERDQLEMEKLRAQIAASRSLADQREKKTASDDPNTLAQRVAGGLQNLATIPGDFGNNTFENAVGTLQGDDDGGIATSVARTWGSIVNAMPLSMLGGGSGNTTQVRRRIAGDTEALAAAIKPLIRKPGEGDWTDKDQQRLVAVVGDLALANNEQEYFDALRGIRSRLQANFGLDLPEIQVPNPKAPQQGGQERRRPRYNPETDEIE